MASVRSVLEDNECVFVRPGDLHLETREMENFRAAEWAMGEIATLIRPDFVQFAGDNVQHATPEQFALFSELTSRLPCPWQAMPGDHDIFEDKSGERYRSLVGPRYAAWQSHGMRFIRLDTVEAKPVGFSEAQLDWFESELNEAAKAGQRVVLFQHHYPFKVWETFDGPGVNRWRSLVQAHPVEGILTGHTHYGQIANDGVNISVATRSIGDPEGGSAGYHIFYAGPQGLSCAYRTEEDQGPAALVIAPREFILCRRPDQIVSGAFEIDAITWHTLPVKAEAQINGGQIIAMLPQVNVSPGSPEIIRWRARVEKPLPKGVHELSLRVFDDAGRKSLQTIKFMCDPTGRFTPIPQVSAWVGETKYC